MSETTPNPCPPPEEIAAFIDGRLEPAEHARIVAHVAGCADCYAVLAGTMDFLEHGDEGEDEERPKPKTPRLVLVGQGEEGDEMPPTESLRPVAAITSHRPSRWGWMFRLAAAVVMGVGAGALLYPVLRPKEPEFSAGQLLAGTELTNDSKPFGDTLRNADPGTSSSFNPDALVLLGASLIDLRMWTREGSPTDVENLARNVAIDLTQALEDDAPEFDPEAFAASNVETATSRTELERRVVELDQRIERLLTEVEANAEYNLGRWAEAGRLAAASNNTGHFEEGSPSREYLAWLMRQVNRPALDREVMIDEAAAMAIEEIAALLETIAGQPLDLNKLAKRFDALLRIYDQPPL